MNRSIYIKKNSNDKRKSKKENLSLCYCMLAKFALKWNPHVKNYDTFEYLISLFSNKSHMQHIKHQEKYTDRIKSTNFHIKIYRQTPVEISNLKIKSLYTT